MTSLKPLSQPRDLGAGLEDEWLCNMSRAATPTPAKPNYVSPGVIMVHFQQN
jgi:hypothetical protein